MKCYNRRLIVKLCLFALVLGMQFVFSGCLGGLNSPRPVPMHQNLQNIAKIELIWTSSGGEECSHVLDESKVPSFVEGLSNMDAFRYFNDPASKYGDFAIEIYYKDGFFDVIGEDINDYFSSSGEKVQNDGWYYLRESDLKELFSKYIDSF